MQICLNLKHFLEIDELKTLISSFILSNINYCPLIIFQDQNLLEKLKTRIKKVTFNDK